MNLPSISTTSVVMRVAIVCIVCLCFCGGCCIGEKMGEAMKKSLAEAWAQWLDARAVPILDSSLSAAEKTILDTQGPNPQYLPWFLGAEIARLALKVGIAPVSPFVRLQLFLKSTDDFCRMVWEFLRSLNSEPDDGT